MVVAIIALLIAILLPSLAKAKTSAQKSACMANLKGIGQDCAIYSAQFDDAIIQITPDASNWLHDQAENVPLILLSMDPNVVNGNNMDVNTARRTYYCPSTPEKDDNTLAWDMNASIRGLGRYRCSTTETVSTT